MPSPLTRKTKIIVMGSNDKTVLIILKGKSGKNDYEVVLILSAGRYKHFRSDIFDNSLGRLPKARVYVDKKWDETELPLPLSLSGLKELVIDLDNPTIVTTSASDGLVQNFLRMFRFGSGWVKKIQPTGQEERDSIGVDDGQNHPNANSVDPNTTNMREETVLTDHDDISSSEVMKEEQYSIGVDDDQNHPNANSVDPNTTNMREETVFTDHDDISSSEIETLSPRSELNHVVDNHLIGNGPEIQGLDGSLTSPQSHFIDIDQNIVNQQVIKRRTRGRFGVVTSANFITYLIGLLRYYLLRTRKKP